MDVVNTTGGGMQVTVQVSSNIPLKEEQTQNLSAMMGPTTGMVTSSLAPFLAGGPAEEDQLVNVQGVSSRRFQLRDDRVGKTLPQ